MTRPEIERRPRVLHHGRDREVGSSRYVYVGRPAKWGNPFKIGEHGTREEVVARFREHVAGRHEEIKRELRGKDLGCWCAPLPCHADVLLEIANDEG